ncbi:MAG: DUF2934 domain-containing protein [Gammaproteobacteria bacterium]|jgi:hypothetical protein
MADVRASTTTGASKAPAKKVTVKSRGKKAAATGARKTIAKAKAKKTNTPKEAAPSQTVTPEERWRMVAEAAYLRAERRGFSGGNPTDDWLAAEAEIETLLTKR